MAAIMCMLTACHKEEDDIFAFATLAITTDVAENIERVQAQAVFTNINSRKVTTTADFNGNVVMHQFRAQTDYAEIMDKSQNLITLKAILLD